MIPKTLPLFFIGSLINVLLVVVGYSAVIRHWRLFGWAALLTSVASVNYISLDEQPLTRMVMLILSTFLSMKIIVATDYYRGKPQVNLTLGQWAVFALAWAGMRVAPFETLGSKPLQGARNLMVYGFGRIMIGSALIALAHILVSSLRYSPVAYITITMVTMIGLSFILHFGLLTVAAGIYRQLGVNVSFLFKAPLKAKSLAEFWGRRWNIAFSEMTSISIYKPLKSRYPIGVAIFAAFAFSGLLHEVAITLPVRRSFGTPLLFFCLQGVFVFCERKMLKDTWLFQTPLFLKVWLALCLLLPFPLLFNEAFVKDIVWPLAGLHFAVFRLR